MSPGFCVLVIYALADWSLYSNFSVNNQVSKNDGAIASLSLKIKKSRKQKVIFNPSFNWRDIKMSLEDVCRKMLNTRKL